MSDDDTPRFTLTIHDESLDLTESEYRDLECMIHHALDGDLVLAVEDADPTEEDLDEIRCFLEDYSGE